jgi:hypothetical protein
LDNARVGLRAIRAGEIVVIVGNIPDNSGAAVLALLPGPVAVRARHVAGNDANFLLNVELAVDGALGVEDLVGDVGHNGGAARGDAAFGDEDEEAGEELVDGKGGVEFGRLGEKVGGEVFEVAGRGDERQASGDVALEMTEAEARFGTGKPAAPAIGIAMQAAGGIVFRGAGVVAGLCCRHDWR